MMQENTISYDVKTVQLFVDVGTQALCVQPETVWVRNGKEEVQEFTNQIIKPDITLLVENEKKEISSLFQSHQTDLTTFSETLKTNINTTGNTLLSDMQNSLSTARKWAVGSIEEEANGSSKYWAQKADETVKNIKSASETTSGFITISTQAQAQAGTNNTTAMSPQKVMNNFVSLNTNQTITGTKTLMADVIRKITCDPSTIPDSNLYIIPFSVENADKSLRTYQQVSYNTLGTAQNAYGLIRTVNGENIYNTITMGIDINGDSFINVLTPNSNSNNTNIATTSWVNTFCKSTNKIVESWSGNNSTSWYRKWSNGFIEQGGIVSATVNGSSCSITKTFYKPFTQSPCIITNYLSTQGIGYHTTKNVSSTGFTFTATSVNDNYQNNSNGITYYACGF